MYPWTANQEVTAERLNLSQLRYGEDAGSTDTYAVTLSPAPTAYLDGQVFTIYFNTSNVGACTLNINGLGAKTIKKMNTEGISDLETGDIIGGQTALVKYDGTNDRFELLSPPAFTPKIKIGLFVLNTFTGNQTIGGIGFRPKCVLFFRADSHSSGGDQGGGVSIGAGSVFTGTVRQVVTGFSVSDAAGSAADGTTEGANIIIVRDASTSSTTAVASLVSLDADGFTINIGTAPSGAVPIAYVAIG